MKIPCFMSVGSKLALALTTDLRKPEILRLCVDGNLLALAIQALELDETIG